MENQHRLVEGYHELDQWEIDLMNRLKTMERGALALLTEISEHYRHEPRWMAIAKTHIEEGFMAAGRSVARPQGYEIEFEPNVPHETSPRFEVGLKAEDEITIHPDGTVEGDEKGFLGEVAQVRKGGY